MIDLQLGIQFVFNVGIFYFAVNNFHTKHTETFVLLAIFNILFSIGGKMYAKKTIKKEILLESYVRSCIVFTGCILISSLINQHKNDKVMIVFTTSIMLLTLYFLNKYYNFSRN